MSKGLGQKIAIKFTQPLVGDIAGLAPPIGIGSKYYLPAGTVTASSQYSSYSPDRAFKDDQNYWYTNVIPAYIQIELQDPVSISGFRWDTRTQNPKDFIVSGSNDGEVWANLCDDTSENITGVKEFKWIPTIPYKFYRWAVSTKWSSYLYIYKIELLEAGGQSLAFTITGDQYKHVYGPILKTEYPVLNVEEHPTQANTILLTFDDLNTGRFNNVLGDIKIEYDNVKGTLQGRGGFVESFIYTFTPTDLVQKLNPGLTENFKINANATIACIKIIYNYRYVHENFKITADAEIILTYVGVINP